MYNYNDFQIQGTLNVNTFKEQPFHFYEGGSEYYQRIKHFSLMSHDRHFLVCQKQTFFHYISQWKSIKQTFFHYIILSKNIKPNFPEQMSSENVLCW